jgi:hypothetical protein
LFFCWEEFDFCLRAIALGWWVRYRGDIEIRHKVSGERRVGWAGDRWFYFVRNRLHIERKNGQGWSVTGPRAAAYLLKGCRNRLVMQTLRAIVAARHMAPRGAQQVLSAAAVSYFANNDQAHRGSLMMRIRREVLARVVHPASVASLASDHGVLADPTAHFRSVNPPPVTIAAKHSGSAPIEAAARSPVLAPARG